MLIILLLYTYKKVFKTSISFEKTPVLKRLPFKIKMSMANAMDISKYGHEAMLKGKVVVIPGSLNRFLAFISRLIPRNMSTSIVRKIQEINRDKQFNYNNS